ncbi:MAG: hypothetical protein IIA61_03920 [Candidatus Marinimicrobia bacterium]|nr:hypothetical protein [Candidatus Neomarinimicrobiota bacterium]
MNNKLYLFFQVIIILIFLQLFSCNINSTNSETDYWATKIILNSTNFIYDSEMLPTVFLVNQSDKSLYVPLVSYIVFEEKDSKNWINPIVWFNQDGIGNTIEIVPGDTLGPDDLRYGYINPSILPNEFRFRYSIYTDKDRMNPLPEKEIVSASFSVSQ